MIMSFACLQSLRALCCPENRGPLPSKANLVLAYCSGLLFLSLFPLVEVTSTKTTLHTSTIPKPRKLQAPSACHRMCSLGRVTNSVPAFTAWLKCHLLYKFYPTSLGRFNCSPFGSLTFCVSLHY